MASVAGSAVSVKSSHRFASRNKAVNGAHGLESVSFAAPRKSLWSRPAPLRFHASYAAKQETVEKVAAIVKKQLALTDDKVVVGESKFSELGADSLDTVEIVMGIEEAFDVSVEEENAQSIATVQDAADMIEKLVEAKCN